MFPDDLNKLSCEKKLYDTQELLLKNTRESFSNIIYQALDDNQKSATLFFDKKLWNENRLLITNELLERFGIITIFNIKGISFYKSLADNKILKDISIIHIDFL